MGLFRQGHGWGGGGGHGDGGEGTAVARADGGHGATGVLRCLLVLQVDLLGEWERERNKELQETNWGENNMAKQAEKRRGSLFFSCKQ